MTHHDFHGHGTIYNGDCVELLATLPDKSIDLVLTDPPYFRVVSYAWDRQWPDIFAFQAWVEKIGVQLQRVMKDNASLYWFGDDKSAAYCQTALDKHFSLINSLVWNKTNPHIKGIMNLRSYAPTTERILFYEQKNAVGLPATGRKAIHSRQDCFQSIKKYMRSERDKVMKAKGFTKMKQFSDYLTELLGHTAHSHYFTDSQFEIPNAKNFQKLQEAGFFRCEYEDLRREYEDLRRVWHPDINAREVLSFNNPPPHGTTPNTKALASHLLPARPQQQSRHDHTRPIRRKRNDSHSCHQARLPLHPLRKRPRLLRRRSRTHQARNTANAVPILTAIQPKRTPQNPIRMNKKSTKEQPKKTPALAPRVARARDIAMLYNKG